MHKRKGSSTYERTLSIACKLKNFKITLVNYLNGRMLTSKECIPQDRKVRNSWSRPSKSVGVRCRRKGDGPLSTIANLGLLVNHELSDSFLNY